MRRLHIKGFVRHRRVPVHIGEEHISHPNLLNREFYSEKPCRKIVTDITYVLFQKKWYYLVIFLDLFNNEILEWELSDTFSNFFVIRTATRLLKRIKFSQQEQVLIHSDQGVQYTSFSYCHLLSEHNVLQSMSRAGTPRDNAVMESFFGRFKDTLRKHFSYQKQHDLHKVVEECVHYFNYVRPLRKLTGRSQVMFRTEFANGDFVSTNY